MDEKEILSHVDHTLLAPTATWDDIRQIVDDGIEYGCASVCIPPSYVQQASDYADGRIKICTVIGFPNGYNTPMIKGLEAAQAVVQGASEVDMVINIGALKDGDDDLVRDEIDAVCEQAKDTGKEKGVPVIVKVIVESADLSQGELERACRIVDESCADYIKTSTGFSKNGGATLDAVDTMARICKRARIKAAGGISSFDDAQAFLDAGADRLGTSRLVAIAKSEQ